MMGSSSLLFNAKITYFLTIAIECAVSQTQVPNAGNVDALTP
jgi:hypothetical protein